MKNIFKNNKAVIAPVTLLLGLLVVGVAIVGLLMYTGTTAPGTVTGPAVGAESGDITLSLANLNGTSVGTVSTLTVHLTSPGVYEDYAAAYEALDEGDIMSPYGEGDPSVTSSTPTDGDVTFALVGTKYDSTDSTTYPGTDFGVVILDSAAVAGTNYCPEVGMIKTTIHKTVEEALIDQVIEGVDGYLGSNIRLSPMGAISIFDSASSEYGKVSYTIDQTANGSQTELDSEVTVRLGATSDKTALYDVGIYVEELDSYAGTAVLTLNDVEVYVNGAKQSGVSLTKVADLESGSAEKKNAPSACGTGTSTMWYVEGGLFDISRSSPSNLDEIVVKLIDYDIDVSASGTSDEARVKYHFMPFNTHEDSDTMTASTFFFILDEDGTTGFA